jgi:hypothetical protein
MAAHFPELDVLPNSMNLNSPYKGAFFQNMYRRRNSWETRAGFGQLAQHNTTLGLNPSGTTEYGFSRQHGLHVIKTNFDHVQLVSVWSGLAYTGNNTNSGQWQLCYSLLVYDATTNQTWEEVLHRKTAEFNDDVKAMPYWRGVYESNLTEDLSDFLVATDRETWFHEHSDTLLFGNEDMGLFLYTPSDFDANLRKQVDGTNGRSWNLPYSESAVLVEVAAVDGVDSDAYGYMKSDIFPRPTDACSHGDRIVYVTGHYVYFTDFGRPGSILARNLLFLPSDEEIVACESVNDQLLLFTPNETWLYQPSLGTTVTQGRLVQMDSNVGCLNASCLIKVGGVAYWMDRRGIYASNGSSQPQEIGQALQPFFDESMSNPLSQYFTETGFSDLATNQPKAFYDLIDTTGAHATYESANELLMFAIPTQSIALCYRVPEQSWSLWNFESMSSGDAPPEVEAQRQLLVPHIAAKDERLFMCCGPEIYVTADAVAPPQNARPRSAYFLEWGRGGGIDRSVDLLEDNRTGHGFYDGLLEAGNTAIFYVGEPIERRFDLGEKLNRNVAPGNTLYLFPVYLHPNSAAGTGTDGVTFLFNFDNTEWTPVFIDNAASTELDFLLPQERWPSRDGWGYGAVAAGTREVQCYSGGVANRTGNQIRLRFDGPSSAGAWTRAPSLDLMTGTKNPLMYLPFVKDNEGSDVTGLDPVLGTTQARPTAGAFADADTYWFQKMNQGSRHDNDDVAQAVDWCMKTQSIRLDNGGVRLRGMLLEMQSHGDSDTPIQGTWIYGVLNMVIGSDWKSWTSQLLDYTGTGNGDANLTEIRNKSSLRSRFMNSAVTSALATKVFGTTTATWGNTANSAHGNLLIDDEAVDQIYLSDSVKGQSATAMVFGFIRNRSERIVLASAKAIAQPWGGRRRRGR